MYDSNDSVKKTAGSAASPSSRGYCDAMSAPAGRQNATGVVWNLLGHVARQDDSLDTNAELAGIPILGRAEVFSRSPNCFMAFEHEYHDDSGISEER